MKREEDLISVIVPVYNIEKYLPKCLESIANQTYGNLEIILVDDGSTDSSGLICDEYAARDSRARVIHQSNQGLWAARNAGQDAATGDFLFFPDGDDYFNYGMLEQMHQAITSGNGYEVAIVERKKVQSSDEDCNRHINPVWKEVSSDELFKSLFTAYPYPNIWNKLYRADSVKGIRAKPFTIAQDLDFNIQVFTLVTNVICTDEVYYYWVSHDGQITKKAPYYKLLPDIYYTNYINLREDKKHLGYILLNHLYKRMRTLKARSLKSSDRDVVYKKCREYYRNTIKDYLKAKNIPLGVKLQTLSIYHFPYPFFLLLRFLDFWVGKNRK